ncbi:FMN adenylyltransferase; riboflavin kinase [Coriobacterium glomerans PW2]|uniref:Riboflavin biosynthesis protein n=1 Tax=Coriobacterium glomerans (strain ATCC 49209 / DSM 20642 / JCM 10262 / PW2) TaxID=700015 RepID=F2N9P4_CORGP|nr:riboflavin biosynthesis protein RibF [Coriobacterium glomerans]AEB07147.1 FMN adenylyltransferase; riboflavin kinase [Coriobacterium glomerans PW2]
MNAPLAELRRDFLVSASHAPIDVFDGSADFAGPRAAAVAIGVFDGVHIGHRDLIAQAVARARDQGISAVVVTFDPDPDRIVCAEPAPELMTTRDRLRQLATLGVDGVLVIPFTRELAALDHVRFFEEVLLRSVRLRSIHVGADFRLGAHGAASVERIRAWCAPRGIDVCARELVSLGGAPVTASRIRRLIRDAEIKEASACLGRRYLVRGRVATGRGEGTGMGFPTANVRVAPEMALPADGVYAGFASVDGCVWPAAINIGVPPMFRDDPRSAHLEATLLGFSGDLYGRRIALTIDRRLRAAEVFPSIEDLTAQVLADIDRVRADLGESGVDLDDDHR